MKYSWGLGSDVKRRNKSTRAGEGKTKLDLLCAGEVRYPIRICESGEVNLSPLAKLKMCTCTACATIHYFYLISADYPFINYYVIHRPHRESHEVYRRIRHRVFEAVLNSPDAAHLNAASAAAAAAAAAVAAASSPTGSSKVSGVKRVDQRM